MSITFNVGTYGICEIPFNESPIVITECCDIVYGQYLTCDTLESCPVIIDLQDSLPTRDQQDALDNSNNPSASNPFATIEDIVTGSGLTCETLEQCQTIIDLELNVAMLTDNLQDETDARVFADQGLQTQINTTNSNLAIEVTNRTNGDQNLQDQIDAINDL